MIDPFVVCIIFIATFMIAGFSIGIAMFCGSILYLDNKDISIATETMLQGLYHKYTLLAIPLFILAADIMNIGSIADRLLRFSEALVGRFRGGLGHAVVSSLIFLACLAQLLRMQWEFIIHMMTKKWQISNFLCCGNYSRNSDYRTNYTTLNTHGDVCAGFRCINWIFICCWDIAWTAYGVLYGCYKCNCCCAELPVEPPTPIRELPKITWNAFPALMLPVIFLVEFM